MWDEEQQSYYSRVSEISDYPELFRQYTAFETLLPKLATAVQGYLDVQLRDLGEQLAEIQTAAQMTSERANTIVGLVQTMLDFDTQLLEIGHWYLERSVPIPDPSQTSEQLNIFTDLPVLKKIGALNAQISALTDQIESVDPEQPAEAMHTEYLQKILNHLHDLKSSLAAIQSNLHLREMSPDVYLARAKDAFATTTEMHRLHFENKKADWIPVADFLHALSNLALLLAKQKKIKIRVDDSLTFDSIANVLFSKKMLQSFLETTLQNVKQQLLQHPHIETLRVQPVAIVKALLTSNQKQVCICVADILGGFPAEQPGGDSNYLSQEHSFVPYTPQIGKTTRLYGSGRGLSGLELLATEVEGFSVKMGTMIMHGKPLGAVVMFFLPVELMENQ